MIPTIPKITLLRAVVGMTLLLSTRVISWLRRSTDNILDGFLFGSMKKWSGVSCLEENNLSVLIPTIGIHYNITYNTKLSKTSIVSIKNYQSF